MNSILFVLIVVSLNSVHSVNDNLFKENEKHDVFDPLNGFEFSPDRNVYFMDSNTIQTPSPEPIQLEYLNPDKYVEYDYDYDKLSPYLESNDHENKKTKLNQEVDVEKEKNQDQEYDHELDQKNSNLLQEIFNALESVELPESEHKDDDENAKGNQVTENPLAIEDYSIYKGKSTENNENVIETLQEIEDHSIRKEKAVENKKEDSKNKEINTENDQNVLSIFELNAKDKMEMYDDYEDQVVYGYLDEEDTMVDEDKMDLESNEKSINNQVVSEQVGLSDEIEEQKEDQRKDTDENKEQDFEESNNYPSNNPKSSLNEILYNPSPSVSTSVSVSNSNSNPRKDQKMDGNKKEVNKFEDDKLEDFKKIGKKMTLIIPHLKAFRDQVKDIIGINIIPRIKNKVNNFKNYDNDFDKISNYIELSISDLKSANNWIEKRIDFVQENLPKRELLFYQRDLIHTKEYYERLLKLIKDLKGYKRIYRGSKIALTLDKIKQEIGWEDFSSKNERIRNDRIQIIYKKIQYLINFYQFVEFAWGSESDSESNSKGKEKLSQEIKFEIPSLSREDRREGKAFVYKGFDDFSSFSKHQLIIYLEDLLEYYTSIKTKYLKYTLREILNSFDKMIENPKSMEMKKNFNFAINSYKKNYYNTLKLTYAIESIEKRLRLVSDEELKKEFNSIKQGMEEVKLYHETAAEIVFSLHKFAKKLINTRLKPDLAKKIVNFILKLKEFDFGEEGPQQKRPVTMRILDLIYDIKQHNNKDQKSSYSKLSSSNKNSRRMYATNNGQVNEVLVKEGDKVWRGKVLMKITVRYTDTVFAAGYDGTVKSIYVKNGTKFKKNDQMIEIQLKEDPQIIESE